MGESIVLRHPVIPPCTLCQPVQGHEEEELNYGDTNHSSKQGNPA